MRRTSFRIILLLTHIGSNCPRITAFVTILPPSSFSDTNNLLRHRQLCCTHSATSTCSINDENSVSETAKYDRSEVTVHRRSVINQCRMLGIGFIASSMFPQNVLGLDDVIETKTSPSSSRSLTTIEIANLLHDVPTFTIVDTDGVPFMVVGEDARVTGYFFTTYSEAKRILTVAQTSVDKGIREEKGQLRKARQSSNQPLPASDPELLVNPWKSARISTVPLDVAITLSLKGLAGNVRNYFYVAPAESDINDAFGITNKYPAEGKVPLFYYTDFTIDTKIPLYFQKNQLITAYRKQNPTEDLPDLQVTELFAVLTLMAQQQDSISNGNDLRNIMFVPHKDSFQRRKECESRNKGKPPFTVGKRNIVL
jgi:hypothetical protein